MYEGGVFKPQEPVELPERTLVGLHVDSMRPRPKERAAAIDEWNRLSDAGVLNSGGWKFTRDELHERD